MKLNNQKRITASMLGVSPKRVKFDQNSLDKIKESITKQDLRVAIKKGEIKVLPKRGISRVRANKILNQKRKGRRSGLGSRQGTKFARMPRKRVWINKVRTQREFLKEMRDRKLIEKSAYRNVYLKIKGGFFRSRGHVKLYLNEQNLIKKNGKEQNIHSKVQKKKAA